MDRFYHTFKLGGVFTKAEVKELKEQLEYDDTEFPVKIPRNGKKPLEFSFPEHDIEEMQEVANWLREIVLRKSGRAFSWIYLPADETNGRGIVCKCTNDTGYLSDNHFIVDMNGLPCIHLEPLLHQDEAAEAIRLAEAVFRDWNSETESLVPNFEIK